jgi:putative N-acetyltransferase (TIGR04045 family)
MLETVRVWGQAISPFCSSCVTAHVASEPWQLDAYVRLRSAIFADEQRLFDGSDADEHDATATPIVAVAHMGGMPDEVIGVVRIYPAARGTWYGGRLGVSPQYRSRRVVGTSLIVAAVSTAHAWGCRRFLATIQIQNVRYFEQHRFRTIDAVEVCGQPHHLMEADLDAYAPVAALPSAPVDSEFAGLLFRRSRAA